MDLKAFTSAISQISEEKGILQEKVLEIIEQALASAYKKEYGEKGQLIKAVLDQESGKTDFYRVLHVVEMCIRDSFYPDIFSHSLNI